MKKNKMKNKNYQHDHFMSFSIAFVHSSYKCIRFAITKYCNVNVHCLKYLHAG